MKEIYLSQRLATTSDRFHLGCLINDDMITVNKDAVWLEFIDLRSKDYPDQTLSWDNPSYLFGLLIDYLENKLTFKLTEEQLEEFEDIDEYMTKENCTDLLELLNTALKLNWH